MTFLFDNEQKKIIESIHALFAPHKSLRGFRLWRPRDIPQKGIYIYGPVGRGKTTLMQTVYDSYTGPKQCYSWDTFTHCLHHQLHDMPLETVAKDIVLKGALIWIDELQLYDIATALLFKRLITALLDRGATVLMTGNVAPADFYKNGLNYELFSDFIPFFEKKFKCYDLSTPKDYRLITDVPHKGTYYVNDSDALYNAFLKKCDGGPVEPFDLIISGRDWQLTHTFRYVLNRTIAPTIMLFYYNILNIFF